LLEPSVNGAAIERNHSREHPHKRRNLRNFHVIDFQGTAMAASFSEGS
jgi:hypothetical protein